MGLVRRAMKALQWAVENFGTSFKTPTADDVEMKSMDVIKSLDSECEKGAIVAKICLKYHFRE